MNVVFVAPSISRKGGGLFPAKKALTQSLEEIESIEITVLGLVDAFTDDDAPTWGHVETRAFDTFGPASLGYAPELYDYLVGEEPDIVHHVGLWRYLSVAGQRWAEKSDQPYIISPHGMLDPWALNNARWKKRIAGWLFEDAHLQEATCIHALNMPEARAIRNYGLDNPICVAPNGVDLPSDQPKENESPWSDEHALPGKHTLLFLGRIHPKKGLPNLLEAWWAVRRDDPDALRSWQLVVVGWSQDGHEDELKAQARELGIASEIHFAGPCYGSQKDAAFRHADAFVLPSHSEGLPMAVLEAWSYRLPVLMTPECNIPAGFEAGAAIQIEPEPDPIAHGLRQLLEMSSKERIEMGERGRELVERQFTWPRVAKQMHGVYRWMLGEADRPDCVITDTNQFALS
jgi:poly(glycerol-phosphate) alpha-glucosyltransferase